MKKLFAYLLIILLLGGVFGTVLHPISNNIKENNPVIGSVLEMISPAVACADSDTVGLPAPPPPPIK